jgi:hypothetical protein
VQPIKGKVILINKVTGDWPFNNVMAPAGVYDAYVNPYGAVSVMATNGEMLGVKPNEFKWLEKQEVTDGN